MDIQVTFPGGKKVDALAGDFIIRTDQHIEDGGNSTAPSPFDLFLVSMATCAGMYVAGFCEGRKISTEGIRLVQRTERDSVGRLLRVTLVIHLPPDFPPQHRAAVGRAASACQVKKTLENPPSFDIVTTVDHAEVVRE